MADKYRPISIEEYAEIWGNRMDGIPDTGFDLTRDLTKEELSYLRQKYSYVQLLNPESKGDFTEIKFMRAASGWLILFYKNAMAASAGENIFTDEAYIHENEGFERVNTGVGTRIKQIIDTSSEMVRIAKEADWPAIHIVNGSHLMSWAVWKAAKDLGMEITGYVPSKSDVERYERIKRNCPNLILTQTPSP